MSQQDTKQIRIQFRVDATSEWSLYNPILLDREIGYERETGKYKIGDGTTPWMDLPYASLNLESILLEDGTNLASVLEITKGSLEFGYGNDTTSIVYDQDGVEYKALSATFGGNNTNHSMYSMVTGKENVNTGNDSLITSCFNENHGKQALISGFMNVNKLADETNVNSSNNVVIGGAYNENQGIDNTIFGHHNKANGYGQTIIGCYNEEDPDATFIIGGGTSTTRANLLKVNNDGSLFINSDIKNMNGDILYPSPSVPKDSLLTVSPIDIVNPTVSATGSVGSVTAPTNRIVVTGKYEDYVGKTYLRFTDNQENIEYIDTILSITERTDGRINIEFGSNKINFASDGNASGWSARIGKSLQLFNVKVLWTDETKTRRIESEEVATQSITAKAINTDKLIVKGIEPLLIDKTNSTEDEIYIYDYNLIGSGTTSENVFACGTVSGKYNRVVVSPIVVNSLTENIIGKTIRFYNDSYFIEETIIDSTLRADGRYNIDYTTTNMPFNITIGALRDLYLGIIVGSGKYKWKPTREIIPTEDILIESRRIAEEVGEGVYGMMQENVLMHLQEKENKAAYTEQYIFSERWENNSYSFEEIYPSAEYDIEISLNGDLVDQQQVEAYQNANIVGSYSKNTIITLGEKPNIDIPIIIKAVRK